MMFTFSSNPIDKLRCVIYNKTEEISEFFWHNGKHKQIECHICGDKLDSYKDLYSPIQCGWEKINKYRWICHKCLGHRNFKPYIEMIDADEEKFYNEMRKK